MFQAWDIIFWATLVNLNNSHCKSVIINFFFLSFNNTLHFLLALLLKINIIFIDYRHFVNDTGRYSIKMSRYASWWRLGGEEV
jgi:hypothetical protein